MPWVRIDDQYPEHPKVVQAGPLGIALQVAALCYCNRHLTDGFVPRAAALTLLDFSDLASLSNGIGNGVTNAVSNGGSNTLSNVRPEDVIAELTRLGMWEEVRGGFQIDGYLEYQFSREQILKAREQGKQRVARYRSRTRDTSPRNGVTNADVTPAPTPTPIGKEQPSVEQARRREQVVQVFDAWKAGAAKNRAKLDGKRERRIRWALDNYPLQDVLDAVVGWNQSPHHRGENDRGTVYNDLELLLRDAGKLETFRDLQRRVHRPPQQTEAERQIALTQARLTRDTRGQQFARLSAEQATRRDA